MTGCDHGVKRGELGVRARPDGAHLTGLGQHHVGAPQTTI